MILAEEEENPKKKKASKLWATQRARQDTKNKSISFKTKNKSKTINLFT